LLRKFSGEDIASALKFFNELGIQTDFQRILTIEVNYPAKLVGWAGQITAILENDKKSLWEINIRQSSEPLCLKQTLIEDILEDSLHLEKVARRRDHKAILYFCDPNLQIPFDGWLVTPSRFQVTKTWKTIRHRFITEPAQHPFESYLPSLLEKQKDQNLASEGGEQYYRRDFEPLLRAKVESRNIKATREEGGHRCDGWYRQNGVEYPLVSVITIVFNGADFLEQTIQSVINQNYENIEYIIVDGGSQDSSLEIINRYKEHIDYWISEPDEGLYDALNKGIRLATGQFVGMIHSDDLYAPEAIQKVVTRFLSEPEVGICYGNLNYVGSDFLKTVGRDIESTFRMVMKGEINHPTCFVRKGIYEKHGGFDTNFRIAADYDLGVRFWKAGVQFFYINSTLAYFRLGGTSSDLFKNQWERYKVRIKNKENVFWSFMIYFMVLTNYFFKKVRIILKSTPQKQ
jgi:GT2 family glycosyltransferase